MTRPQLTSRVKLVADAHVENSLYERILRSVQ